MKLALISDTHGRAAAARAALELLDEHAPDRFLHLGDVGARGFPPGGVLDELARVAAGRPVDLLAGNADPDPAALAAAAADRGLTYRDGLIHLELAGLTLAGLHGHETDGGAAVIGSGRYDAVLHGHTHRRRDETAEAGGRTVRIINPGAAWRATPRSCAILDLPGLAVTFLDVPK